jgi:hypothetical protein
VDLEVFQDYIRPYYLKWFYFRIWPSRRASYLTDGWNKANFPLSNKTNELVTQDSNRPDLLFLPMTDWHARIQRSQQLLLCESAPGL